MNSRVAIGILLFVLMSGAAFGQASVQPASIPNGEVGVFYNASFTATGVGSEAEIFVSAGTLPPGLGFTQSNAGAPGVLSGTPTTFGTYQFTIQANGSGSASRGYTVVIAPPPLAFTTTFLPDGVAGASYSMALTATGGTGSYTFSVASGTLPPGITLAPSGLLSGIPTVAGNYFITFRVSSPVPGSVPATATSSFGLRIDFPPLVITTTQLTPANLGVPYGQTLTATGGGGAFTWSVVSGTLPPGISLSPSGVLSGVPTTLGSFNFTVQVTTPGLGGSTTGPAPLLTATRTLNLQVVIPPFTIRTSQLASGVVGQTYFQALDAIGGTPPYTWELAQGRLPDGLTLEPRGAIIGIPTVPGIFSLTLRANDDERRTEARGYTITIQPAPLAITTATLPDGFTGVPYAATMAATGGTPPYIWSVSAGSLPNGVTISTAGVISGTPTSTGPFNVTIQVADSGNLRPVARSYTGNIQSGLRITTTGPLPGGTVGTSFTQIFAATGGFPPLSWSIESGNLPGGLSLNTETGVLNGTPTAPGTFNFVVAVADRQNQRDRGSFSIVVVAALVITTESLPSGVVGLGYSQSLAATGGTPPYLWSLSEGSLPGGVQLNPTTGGLSGTPSAAGTFTFTVQAADTANRRATKSFTVTIIAALTITTQSLPGGTIGTAYNQTLAAAGGTPPLTWSTTGNLPAGVTLNGSTGALSGTPTGPGTFNFTAMVADGRQTATRSFSVVIGVPPGPGVTITGPADTVTPATQPALGMNSSAVYPVEITGTVTLTFAPDAGPDDPAVQFTGGGRTLTFRIPAGQTVAGFTPANPSVQTGTVAGLITLTSRLQAAGVDITPNPTPTRTLRINRAAPIISSASIVRNATGFELVVIGFSTAREVLSAAIHFNAAGGVTLSTTDVTIQLGPSFTTWFQSAASGQFGSQFLLRIPFTVQGNTSPIVSLTVALSNSVGSSATVTVPF